MSFFKKAQAKLDAFSDRHGGGSSGQSGPPQIPFGSKPRGSGGDKPDVMTLRDRFIVRNKATGQLEVDGTGEVVRFASLCAPEASHL